LDVQEIKVKKRHSSPDVQSLAESKSGNKLYMSQYFSPQYSESEEKVNYYARMYLQHMNQVFLLLFIPFFFFSFLFFCF